jgi:hypothetical protein
MKRSLLFTMAVISLMILFTSCKGKKEPYSILEFKGDGTVANYSKSYMTISYETYNNITNSILAEKGDLIFCGESSLTSFTKSSVTKFSFNADKEYGYINGKLRTITIPEKDDQLPSFLGSDTTDFSQLEFITFGSKVPESYIPFLTRLAKIRPDAGLSIQNGLANLSEILKLFNPGIILGSGIPVKNYDLLSGEPNLETLVLVIDDSLQTKPLPAMAELEQLIIEGSDNGSLTGDKFLANNSQLERLSVISLSIFDCAVLKPLTNLRELMIFDCDTVLNAELINEHKSLEVLNPFWDDFRYDFTEKDLPSLRWITITSLLPQTEFESLIASNPSLEVVEIVKNNKINNLQPLLSLKNLFGLTVVDTLTDINTIKSLKNLKYLSLPKGVINDSIKKAMIHQALPGTVLASNEGVCLGSGWLLLLIPFVILFRFISMKKRGVS